LFYCELLSERHWRKFTEIRFYVHVAWCISAECTNVLALLAVAYQGFHFGGIHLTQITYLPGYEFVALAVLSLCGTTHGNFGYKSLYSHRLSTLLLPLSFTFGYLGDTLPKVSCKTLLECGGLKPLNLRSTDRSNSLKTLKFGTHYPCPRPCYGS